MLANPSLQLRFYKIGLREDRNQIADIEREVERLKGMEEAESLSKMNQEEFLQDQAILLNERRIKYISEIEYLKEKVAMLGMVAKLIGDTTFPFNRCHSPSRERDDQLNLLRIRNCVEKVGAASQMIFDMTRMMAQASAEK